MRELYALVRDLLSHRLNNHFRIKHEFLSLADAFESAAVGLTRLGGSKMTVEEGFISKSKFFRDTCLHFTNSEHFNFLHTLITTEVLSWRVLHNVLLFVLLLMLYNTIV